jgi:hypothetical protein
VTAREDAAGARGFGFWRPQRLLLLMLMLMSLPQNEERATETRYFT